MTQKQRTILVVDDIPDEIVILDEILKKDYQVKAVTSGEAALRIARSDDPPDLILLDIIMPGMDGFEVCRNLKQDAEGAMIPVIFLTAKVMTADEKLGLELGAVDYIKKPVEPELVLTRIRAQLERRDQILRSSEVRFRRLFETSGDGIMIFDDSTEMLIDVNPAMAGMMGVPQEYFLGKRVSEIASFAGILARKEPHKGPSTDGYLRFRAQLLETIDGRNMYVDVLCNSYKVNNRDVTQMNLKDITGHVIAERERDELAAKLNHYLSTSPTITYSLLLKDGNARWQWVSENVKNLLGYAREEALKPDWWFMNVNAADRSKALSGIVELIDKEAGVREYRFTKKDRSIVWLHDEMRLTNSDRNEYEIVGTLTDISARKRAEEELLLKSAALEATVNAIVISDRSGVIKWANRAFETLTGYSREEAIGTNPRDVASPKMQSEASFRKMWETIFSGHSWSGELDDKKKNGEPYSEEITITPVVDAEGLINDYIAIISDITERKKARERLEALIREKNELLREIHHRVGNNVQVMISLLNISADQIDDNDLREKLGDITRRMQSMALIHLQFYEAEDMSRIDFAAYLRQLNETILGEFPYNSKKSIVEGDIGEMFLGLDQAIPAGLIVCELLTNAMKYGLSGDRADGTIVTTQRIVDNSLEVEIRDDGIGLPPSFDPDSAQSLGMMLIRILTKQLGAKVAFKSGKGTIATLTIPIKP